MESICQTCYRFNCSWHLDFQPVEGWNAIPTTIKRIHGTTLDSFCVKDCPLYIDREGNSNPLGSTWKRIYLKDISKLLDLDIATVSKRIERGTINEVLKPIGYMLKRERDGKEGYSKYYIKEI